MGKSIIFIATIVALLPPPNTTRFDFFFITITIPSCLPKNTLATGGVANY